MADATSIFGSAEGTGMTYFEIAMKSFSIIDAFFQLSDNNKWYNDFAAWCPQIIEKMLKGILEKSALSDDELFDLLDGHSLRALRGAVCKIYGQIIPRDDCAWLSDFYFDARYPGDDFVVVSKHDAEEVLKVTKKLADPLIDLYRSITKS